MSTRRHPFEFVYREIGFVGPEIPFDEGVKRYGAADWIRMNSAIWPYAEFLCIDGEVCARAYFPAEDKMAVARAKTKAAAYRMLSHVFPVNHGR